MPHAARLVIAGFALLLSLTVALVQVACDIKSDPGSGGGSAGKSAAPAGDKAAAREVDWFKPAVLDSTVAVVLVDLNRFDAAATRELVRRTLPASLGPEAERGLDQLFGPLSGLKAAGVTQGAVLWHLTGGRDKTTLALKRSEDLAVDSARQIIADQLPSDFARAARGKLATRPGVALMGDLPEDIPGSVPSSERAESIRAALSGMPASACRVFFRPNAEMRAELARDAARQSARPPERAFVAVLNEMQWAAASVEPVQSGRAMIIAQARDADSAQRLGRALKDFIATIEIEPARQVIDRVCKIEVRGDRVYVEASMADMAREMPALLQPAVEKARESAEQLRRMTELRQVALALAVYANENRDRLPTSLEAIRPYVAPDDAAAWRRLMLTADGRPRWVLTLPGVRLTDVAEPHRVMLAYEAFTAWPAGGIAVAFVDGHLERIETPQAFERLVAALPKPRTPTPTPTPAPAVKNAPAKR